MTASPASTSLCRSPTEDGRSGRAAAPCVFWMHAHERTFDTVAEDHGNCSVGRFIHGFAEAADILDKDDVADLLEVGWVTMEAFSGVAALSRRSAGVRYGPLAEAHDVPRRGAAPCHPGR